MGRDDEETESRETLVEGSGTTQVDPDALPVVDIMATIATKQDAEPAELIRDRALDVQREMDELATIRRPPGTEGPRAVDVNATIVTQRARTAAEHERDLAFEKLRDGTADDLRSDRKPPAATASQAAKRNRMADGLPWLVTKAVQIRGARSRPDEDSGVPTLGTGNEMRGTINQPGHDNGTAIDGDGALVDRLPADDDERALVGRSEDADPDEHATRRLPREGEAPDELEASMGAPVQPMSRPWWQRRQFLVPLGALATAAGIALVVINRDAPAARPSLTKPRDVATSTPGQPTPEHAPTLGGIPPEMLEAVGPELELDEGDDTDFDAHRSILPVVDYGWLDTLDDDGLARAESWLAGKR